MIKLLKGTWWYFSVLITQTFFVCGWISPYLNFRWGQNLRFVINTDPHPHRHPNLSLSACLHQCLLTTLSLPPLFSPSLSPQLDDGGHGAVAEGVGGAAAVREELPGLQGHGEHVTSVGAAHFNTHLLLSSTFVTNSKGAERQIFASRDDGEAGD